ncbi:Cyclin, N-terminal domain [Musa troglodytarum]|uniref:Cyclin, N-terminal domain n=1 Tax=Musa troglodytarum TaxID=320322 RepID=A0A9E7FVH6_9LILI|nr:Cyclin, N-terminal domain [Musa troglodytarum]
MGWVAEAFIPSEQYDGEEDAERNTDRDARRRHAIKWHGLNVDGVYYCLTDEQLKNPPSRKMGSMRRRRPCCGFMLGTSSKRASFFLDDHRAGPFPLVLLQEVIWTLSFAIKFTFFFLRVAASCVWLASMLEECPKKSKAPNHCLPQNGMNVEGENLPIELLDVFSKLYWISASPWWSMSFLLIFAVLSVLMSQQKYTELKNNLLAALGVPPQLRQEANDSLQVPGPPLPENPPRWLVFDAAKSGIDEVCRVIAHLYSLSKAQCIPLHKENDSFTSRNKIEDRQTQLRKESLLDDGAKDSSTPKLGALTTDASLFKAAITKATQLDELKETMKLGDDSRRAPAEADSKEETKVMPKIDSNSDSNTDKIHERDRERTKTRDHDSRVNIITHTHLVDEIGMDIVHMIE